MSVERTCVSLRLVFMIRACVGPYQYGTDCLKRPTILHCSGRPDIMLAVSGTDSGMAVGYFTQASIAVLQKKL